MIREIAPGLYESSHSIYNMEYASGFKTSEEKPTSVKIENSKQEKTGEIASWGSDNNHPQKILKEIRKTGVMGSAISVRQKAHYGSGLTLYRELPGGQKEILSYSEVPAFKAFDRLNYLNKFYIDIIRDLEIHKVAFPEYVVSRGFSTITRVKRQNSSFCRFELMKEKTGMIENVYLSADWENPNQEYITKIPCFNWMTPAEEIREICKKKKYYKFIVPIFDTMDDEVYYPKPFWQAPIRNGWARVVQSVPALKDAIQKNQLHFKYLISIAKEYYTTNYEDWDSYTADKRKEIYETIINKIDAHLSGVKAGGRSLTAPMYRDESGKPVKSIEIEPIEDKLKDGAYLPDATAGNSEILFALQVDPALIGQGVPGGKNLSGSGSDKREAYTILCASLVADRVTSLLPFYFMRDWNNWGDDVDAGFPNIVLTTLDKNPSGQQTNIN